MDATLPRDFTSTSTSTSSPSPSPSPSPTSISTSTSTDHARAPGPVLVPSGARAATRLLWAGRVVGGIPTAFLLFDAAIKIAHVAPVTESMDRLGFPDPLSPGIGFLELALLALYLVRRTAALGAVLLTGYLGGAVALHLRVGDPLASHTLFPVYVGLLLWAGLFLRDARVRALFAADR